MNKDVKWMEDKQMVGWVIDRWLHKHKEMSNNNNIYINNIKC